MNASIPTYASGLAAEQANRVALSHTVAWILIASGAFHISYLSAVSSVFVVLYLFALVRISHEGSARQAFYCGLAVGFLIACARLGFFGRIFGVAAIALWFVYAFWVGCFTLSANYCIRRLPGRWGWYLIPFLWCGLEYFRGELYYLRFSWLTPGLAFGEDPVHWPIGMLGTYGMGFLLMAIATTAAWKSRASIAGAILILLVSMAVVGSWGRFFASRPDQTDTGLMRVAGVQLEFPNEKEVLIWLDAVARRRPEADLLVLSEYAVTGSVPETVKAWCREHGKYLVIGGKDHLSNEKGFRNTAFVIAPSGEIVFRQDKSVPIQFFDDGLPAKKQAVWESPWGKVGICICYDLSYTRVTDRLIELGAQALIVPTMDVAEWGKRQHELHGRIAPVRAAEYQVPIFRLASSGISQAIDPTGRVIAQAPCPGQGAIISADLPLPKAGRRPVDRWLAPAAAGLTAGSMAALAIVGALGKWRKKPGSS